MSALRLPPKALPAASGRYTPSPLARSLRPESASRTSQRPGARPAQHLGQLQARARLPGPPAPSPSPGQLPCAGPLSLPQYPEPLPPPRPQPPAAAGSPEGLPSFLERPEVLAARRFLWVQRALPAVAQPGPAAPRLSGSAAWVAGPWGREWTRPSAVP